MLKWAPLIFQGFLFNILVSFMSMAIGTAAGTLLGLAQISLLRPMRRTAWYATQFFRNAPWLVLLFYCMFLLPFELSFFGFTIPLPAWFKAVIGLSLPVMANVAEVVRGGIQSIPLTQWESAEARTDLFIPMYLMLLSWFFIYCYPIARWTVALEQRFAVK
jgi:polar amino acid transport system permease protein